MPALDEMVTITRVAKVLEVDPSLLMRRAQRRQIPAEKIGNYWITSLRKVLEAEAARPRGKRGPAAKPLPERVRRLLEAETPPTA